MHASVVERQKQIEIAEFEIQRREKELDYVIRKPAEAEKYRLEKMAEAYKKRVIMEAEAEAEAIAIKGVISFVTSLLQPGLGNVRPAGHLMWPANSS